MSVILKENGGWEYTTPNRDSIEKIIGALQSLYSDKHPTSVKWATCENIYLHLLAYKLKECGYPREGVGDREFFTLTGRVTVEDDGLVFHRSVTT